MSTDDSHLRLPYPSEGLARYYGEQAVREARAILAATEPDTCETASFGIERIAARNCAPSVWTGALAEALAAFVDRDDCQCGGPNVCSRPTPNGLQNTLFTSHERGAWRATAAIANREQHAATHKPGPLSRKAEFERE